MTKRASMQHAYKPIDFPNSRPRSRLPRPDREIGRYKRLRLMKLNLPFGFPLSLRRKYACAAPAGASSLHSQFGNFGASLFQGW
jgi:hypothetical protein